MQIFVLSFIEIGMLVLEKVFFSNMNICKYAFPYCVSSQPLGSMMCTHLNLHYIIKLSCKYELFWLSGSWEDFQMTPPYFCICVIISHLKRISPFICAGMLKLVSEILPRIKSAKQCDVTVKICTCISQIMHFRLHVCFHIFFVYRITFIATTI
jgi:hypothetical protein